MSRNSYRFTLEARHLLEVVEAAYDLPSERSQWLQKLAVPLAAVVDQGLGVYIAAYEVGADGVLQWNVPVAARPVAPVSVILDHERLTAEFLRSRFSTAVCGTASQHVAEGRQPEVAFRGFIARLSPYGVKDGLGINAGDPEVGGCMIRVPLPVETLLRRAHVQLLSRLSGHLTRAFRLLRQLAAKTEKERKARASTRAERGASSPAAVLAEAVQTIESFAKRSQLPFDETNLMQSRWTVTESIETASGRHVLLRENRGRLLRMKGLEQLSSREKQILDHLCRGQSTKVAAYELGIAESTVRVIVHSVLRKLGVRSREQLLGAIRQKDVG